MSGLEYEFFMNNNIINTESSSLMLRHQQFYNIVLLENKV